MDEQATRWHSITPDFIAHLPAVIVRCAPATEDQLKSVEKTYKMYSILWQPMPNMVMHSFIGPFKAKIVVS